jgi:hypothetical protein
MTNAAHYKMTGYTSHGWEIVLEMGDGEAELIGYYPSKAEAFAVLDVLKSLRSGR